jgi:phage tail sheath protein FI
MRDYLTPGVYVEEISTLPPSVAAVATAIPAFIGYTALGVAGEVEVDQVSTLLEYEQRFGKAGPTDLVADADGNIVGFEPLPAHALWYAVNLYFKNGGGRCYVVSVDNEASALARGRFDKGLEALELEDEPTLIVMPEAVALPQADFDGLNQAALALCRKLGDRFAILDVKDGDVAKFRNGVLVDNLMYGAAYHPYVETSLTPVFDEARVKIGTDPASPTLASLKNTNTALYNTVKKRLADLRAVLPPSAGMAGVYARVDRERGVWKAPANVGLMSVIGPVEQISADAQERLNVDANSGKSINAIRAFPGRGTLVWGARTLAGNDNEWRYVPVRRLFIMIEESARKSSAFAVFEPNDATTWLKVKGMLDSYLFSLWEQGALQGSTPETAFYVNVGLGKTMSAQDVLEGRLIVEIGIAAVRPAEFIVLRFSHKLAEA